MDQNKIDAKDRVVIFDTTLRDGEQSPGAALNVSEKIEIARALEEMVVEAVKHARNLKERYEQERE
jgi:2-isopropylmalate synthase